MMWDTTQHMANIQGLRVPRTPQPVSAPTTTVYTTSMVYAVAYFIGTPYSPTLSHVDE